MKCLLLAAGYSTRLYPLTENFPKPLLDIAGKPVINYLVEKLEKLNELKEVYVITNSKFYNPFLSWRNSLKTSLKIEIIDDGTNNKDNRLGAIGDIQFVINKKKLDDDLLILGGDQLFKFYLNDFVDFFKKENKDVTMVIKERNKDLIKQSSCVVLDKNKKLIFFEEKPENPSSDLISRCIYIYKKDTLKLIEKYLEEKNNPDQPGRFVQWLYKKKEILGFISNNDIIDIGTHETLEKAKKVFTSS
ncbi:nucleotidyltransferase family protein [Candidatus Woesearchaeota archaeon]|nr:nucleotidyltransferase family protein [Candidatus Woesearchaeota archaeon]